VGWIRSPCSLPKKAAENRGNRGQAFDSSILTSPYYFNVRMKATNATISARLKLLPYGGIFPLPLLIIADKRASDVF
jgi:hypothetical protein